jgi:hypothetical protein
MVPDRCATCPRKCWQRLADLHSPALDDDQRPMADARPPTDQTLPPGGSQARCEPRLAAA